MAPMGSTHAEVDVRMAARAALNRKSARSAVEYVASLTPPVTSRANARIES